LFRGLNYKNIKIHIHDADTKSFLRHWKVDKYGDSLKKFRYSLLEVKEKQKPFITVEIGRAGMLLRGISPILDKAEFVGSVEFIQGFNSIVKKAKKDEKYDVVFLSCSEEKEIHRFQTDRKKIGSSYLSQKKDVSNLKLLEVLEGLDTREFVDKTYFTRDEFFLTAVPVLNHEGKRVGCAVIAADISIVNSYVEDTEKALLNQIYIIVLLDIVLLLGLLLILNMLIKKPVELLVEAIKSIEKSLNENDLKDLYYKNKININHNDEIGEISKTINVLLKNIAKTFSELQKSNKTSSEYLKAVDAGSIVSKSDLRGIITYVNDALCAKTGYKREELIGKPHNIFRHPNTSKKTFEALWNTIAKGKIYHSLFKNIKKDGTSFYANITIVPIRNENEEIVEYIALRDDVTELVNSQKELKRNFLTDPLTSLGNRFKIVEDITHKQNSYLAIFDIQSFKEVNDFYGYHSGDKIIKELSERIYTYFSGYRFEVYRLSGDEFAVLVDSTNIEKNEFFKLASEFMEEIKLNSFHIDDHKVFIQMTCGVSYNPDNLMNEANIAHKYAKKNNQEIINYKDEINTDEEYKKNLEWTNEIKSAIEENRIKAYYQPIINTSNNKIEKYETLMRLIKTDGKEVSPFFFLDIAKKTRLYKDLTKIVVTQAFEKFSGTVYEFSINLSAEDIILHDVSEWLFDLALEYKVNNQLVIEIVESESIESFDIVDTFIHNAKAVGMKIAIDDFGTGYSNFEYLIKLNTDFLKIDGSLIKEIDSDEKIYSVVETIVDFAKKNNIKTIGEFIATESLYEKIKDLEIDFGQGFYLGKPSLDLI